MVYINRDYSKDPPWYLEQFPVRLIKLIRLRALDLETTVTDVLVSELGPIAARLMKDPENRAPEIASFGETKRWPVKHFPEPLRKRLTEIAKNEKTSLWKLVAREMFAASELWGRK